MEEDIKILEEYLEIFDVSRTYHNEEYEDKIKKAIENLIARNKELESEIQHKNDQMLLQDREIDRHYIPKSKIKEKIEELENSEPSDDDYNFEAQNDIHSKIDILQELLEEE